MYFASLLPLILASASLAAPAEPFVNRSCKDLSIHDLGGLPAPQNPISFVLLGVGTQNYTCSSAGTFATAGAVAKLFDVSCISNADGFSELTTLAYNLWNKAPASESAADAIYSLSFVNTRHPFGDHYFVTSPSGTGISPKWDATSGAFNGNAEAFMLGARAAGVPAPTGSADIDWLYLTNVSGELAKEVYRTGTKGGQPPASCTAGQSTTVKYTSFYYLAGGSV